jgi:hypothetical protein
MPAWLKAAKPKIEEGGVSSTGIFPLNLEATA